jgi:alkylhydroperoxidase family enzyme
MILTNERRRVVSAPNPQRTAPVQPTVLLAPLPADRWDEEVDAALAGMLPRWRRTPENAGNGLSTLVNHPALTKAFLPYNVHLLFSSTISPRIRELAILRIAHHCDAPYEWEHHVEMGTKVGLTDTDIAAIADGTAQGFDGVVLQAVDELHESARISPQTWAALGEQFDDRQRMDLIFTVGTYATLAMAFNTFGVQLDHDLEHENLDNIDLRNEPNEG